MPKVSEIAKRFGLTNAAVYAAAKNKQLVPIFDTYPIEFTEDSVQALWGRRKKIDLSDIEKRVTAIEEFLKVNVSAI